MRSMADVRSRLMQTGCSFNFKRRAWACPACRVSWALRIRPEVDGSVAIACAQGCPRGAILGALGLTFAAVGPTCFRRGSPA